MAGDPKARADRRRKRSSAGRLFSGKAEIKKTCETANCLSKRLDGTKNWREWRRLITVHSRCDRQVRAFGRLRNLLRRGEGLGLGQKDRRELLEPFEHLLEDTADEYQSSKELEKLLSCWTRARNSVEEKIPSPSIGPCVLEGRGGCSHRNSVLVLCCDCVARHGVYGDLLSHFDRP